MITEILTALRAAKTIADWLGLPRRNPPRTDADRERWHNIYLDAKQFIRDVLALDASSIPTQWPRLSDDYCDLLRETDGDFEPRERKHLETIYAIACGLITDHPPPLARKALASPTLDGDDNASRCRYWLIHQRKTGLLDIFERYISVSNNRHRRRSPINQLMHNIWRYIEYPTAVCFAGAMTGWYAIDNTRRRLRR